MPAQRLLCLMLLAATLSACGVPTARNGADPGATSAAVAPDVKAVAASLSDAGAREVAAGINALGFDLLHELMAKAEPGENVVISPISAAVLLTLLRAGAGESAGTAINKVLSLDADAGEEADRDFAALLYRLRDTEDIELSVANALFAAPGYPLEASFIQRTGRSFEATLENADLGSQEAADRIDEWVTDKTEGLITSFAEQLGLPDPQAVVVLLNAVYFKGTWTTQFDPANTQEGGTFTLDDGTTVDVPLMSDYELEIGFRQGGTGILGRLPYGAEKRYAMEILLPNPDRTLADTVKGLDAPAWADLTTDLVEEAIPVTLPRFETEWADSLDDPLKSLGMGPAYSDDYAPMSPNAPFLSTIQQKTFIKVDEKGTEAAAVSGGVMLESAPAAELRVDRPFVFAITDSQTGAILFLGAIADPTA